MTTKELTLWDYHTGMSEYDNDERIGALDKVWQYWQGGGAIESEELKSLETPDSGNPDDYAEEIYALWRKQGKAFMKIQGAKRSIEDNIERIRGYLEPNKRDEEKWGSIYMANDLCVMKWQAEKIIQYSNQIEMIENIIEDLRAIWHNHPEAITDDDGDNEWLHTEAADRANKTAILYPESGMGSRCHTQDCRKAEDIWQEANQIGNSLLLNGILHAKDFGYHDWSTWDKGTPARWDNKVHEYHLHNEWFPERNPEEWQ